MLFGIAGVFFGLLLGWIIGSQQAGSCPADATAPEAQHRRSRRRPTPPPLDEARVDALRAPPQNNPEDAAPRVELGNLYFDHERFAMPPSGTRRR